MNDINELRRELLDNRATSIDRWLTVIAVVLTGFGLIVPVVGYLGYTRFESIEKDAKEQVAAAKTHVDEASKVAAKSQDLLKEIEENLTKSYNMVQGTNLAVLLQTQGQSAEAIGKWQEVARIAEGRDTKLVVTAWNEIIRLKADSASAEDFAHRALAWHKLGEHEAAGEDFRKWIELSPTVAIEGTMSPNSKSWKVLEDALQKKRGKETTPHYAIG